MALRGFLLVMLSNLLSPFVVGILCRIGAQVVSFSAVVVASGYLSLDEFGVYAIAWACTVIATTFVFSGFYQAIQRSVDFERDANTLFWLMCGVGGLGTLALLCAAWLAGGTGSSLGLALLLLAPIPLLATPTAWNEAQLLRAQRIRAASAHIVVAEALALAAAFAAFEAGYGVFSLVGARYVAAVVALAITTALVRALPRMGFRHGSARQGFATALPLWGTTAVGLFANYGTDLILAAFLSPAAVGAYRGGARIAVTASDVVFQPLRMLTWSRFARLERDGDIDRLRVAWRENMSLGAAIVWPFMASLALLAPSVVMLLFGETWLPAAAVVTVLCASKAVSVLEQLLEPTLVCLKRGGLQLKLRLAGAVLLLALLLVFGRHGAEAAAAAHLVATSILGGLSVIAMVRALGLRALEVAVTFLPGGVVTTLCICVILAIEGHGPAVMQDGKLIVTLLALAFVWLATAAVFFGRRILVLPTH